LIIEGQREDTSNRNTHRKQIEIKDTKQKRTERAKIPTDIYVEQTDISNREADRHIEQKGRGIGR
jgi:hypothetical protein